MAQDKNINLCIESRQTRKEEIKNKIIDLFTDNNVTYGEATEILKALDFELGRRKFNEPIKKE